jgi:hypothetical protein
MGGSAYLLGPALWKSALCAAWQERNRTGHRRRAAVTSPPAAGDGIDFIDRVVDPVRCGRLDRVVDPVGCGSFGRDGMRILRSLLVALFVVVTGVVGAPGSSFAQIGVAITIAPPVLPVYAQPPIPAPGYLWTPGYWAYGAYGYYWVPGTWVRPPVVGLLWTPGYWGWGGAAFVFHAGFWGPTIGFYGGVNYGFGYGGVGYAGGYWSNGNLYYNHSVNNFGNTRIANVYNRNVTVNKVTNVSYNGGAGGTTAQATPAEQAAAHDARVVPATQAQVQHQQTASTNPALRVANNHGTPPIAATSRAGEFTGRGVVAARGAPAARPVPGAAERPAPATGPHAAVAPQEHRNVPPQSHPAAPETAQQRAAQQHAAQQRAAQQRAAQQRAAQQRAAQQRAAHERAPQRPEDTNK